MNYQEYIPIITNWLLSGGIQILIILIGAWIVKRVSKLLIERIIRKIVLPDYFVSKKEEKKREDTLIQVVNGTIAIVI